LKTLGLLLVVAFLQSLFARINGIVLVRDLFSLYIFLEIAGVSAFILIGFTKDRLGLEGAFKYLILSAIATSMILFSIGIFLLFAPNVQFITIRRLVNINSNRMVLLAIALFISGVFLKGGLVPFHGWLPDAYTSAPDLVSIILGGLVTKATGLYTLIRFVNDVIGYRPYVLNVILFIGTLTIFFGAFGALGQHNMKRMLAYSSMSQMGYIALGIASGNVIGLIGSVFHLFNHSIFKSLLFIDAYSVKRQTRTLEMDNLGGLIKNMPIQVGLQ
jgi:multicomponent Na+:H+ antiporter subunit D